MGTGKGQIKKLNKQEKNYHELDVCLKLYWLLDKYNFKKKKVFTLRNSSEVSFLLLFCNYRILGDIADYFQLYSNDHS